MAVYRTFDMEEPPRGQATEGTRRGPSAGQVPCPRGERPRVFAITLVLLVGCATREAEQVAIFSGPGRQRIHAVAPAPEGGIYVAGVFEQTIDLDPRTGIDWRSSAGAGDVFILQLSADGRPLWAHTFGGARQDEVSSIAATDAGVVLTGHFGDTVDFDPGPGADVHSKVGPYSEGYVLALDHEGAHRFTTVFAGTIEPDNAYGAKVASLRDGTILVSGQFRGRIDFDPGPQRRALEAQAGHDGFVTKLNADGSLVWARQIGGSGEETSRAVPTDDGGVWMAGTFTGSVDLDPGPGTDPREAQGAQNGYGVRLDPAGRLVAGGVITEPFVAVSDLAVATDGGLWVGGAFSAALAGAEHGFVVRLGADGRQQTFARAPNAVRVLVLLGEQVIVGGERGLFRLERTRFVSRAFLPGTAAALAVDGAVLTIAGSLVDPDGREDAWVSRYRPSIE